MWPEVWGLERCVWPRHHLKPSFPDRPGKLDSHSQFQAASQLSHEGQSPPPSFSQFPASLTLHEVLCSWGDASGRPQARFWSLAVLKAFNHKGFNFSEDLRGRGCDLHRAFYFLWLLLHCSSNFLSLPPPPANPSEFRGLYPMSG